MEYNNACIHQELNMIQDCIKRMASNSFMLKGWYVSLVFLGASILSDKNVNIAYPMLLLLVLTCVFWGLDGFFLKMETLYRWKYEWVIVARVNNDTSNLYDLNPYNKCMWSNPIDKAGKLCVMKYVLSKTLLPLYGPGFGVSAGYFIFRLVKCLFC